MPYDKEISELFAASGLTGNETLHVIQSGNSRRTTSLDVARTAGKEAVNQIAKSPQSATISVEVIESTVTLTGASVESSQDIPAGTLCLGVSSRVLAEVTGATSFDVGISGEVNKFGGSLALTSGSTNVGVVGPTPFYTDTPVLITANGSNFTGGELRLAIHILRLTTPTA